jgi:uncharacterized protein (TIGR02118 family)
MSNSLQYTGVRSFAFIPKKQGVTDDEFAAYWHRVKPQRAGALAVAAGMSQSLLLAEKVDSSPRLFNGVVEAWDKAQSAADLQRALSTPEKIYDESARFMDLDHIVVLSGVENIVQWGPAHIDLKKILRALWVVTRKPGMSLEAFQDHWRHIHAPLVPRTPSMVRYIQYHVSERRSGAGMPQFDGVAELSWNNLEEYSESWQSYQMQHEQFPDMPNFLDLTRIAGGFFQEIWRSASICPTILRA